MIELTLQQVREVADHIIGTMKSIDQGLQDCGIDATADILSLDTIIVFDQLLFTCDCCGWTCDIDECAPGTAKCVTNVRMRRMKKMMTKRQFFLLKLMEECNEVAHRASKQMQFGADEKQSQGPSETKVDLTNRDRLHGEIIDLLAVVAVLHSLGEIPDISPDEIEAAHCAKLDKLGKYLEYSRSLGMVAPEAA